LELLPDRGRALGAEGLSGRALRRSIVWGNKEHLRERRSLDHAPRLPGLLVVVGLEAARKGLVGLVGDHRQAGDFTVVDPGAMLVDGQAQAASDLLATRDRRARVSQGADLEDVGVVPSLAQGRVGEDEAQGLAGREQLLLAPHDLLVGRAVQLALAARVLGSTLGVLAEIGVVYSFDRPELDPGVARLL